MARPPLPPCFSCAPFKTCTGARTPEGYRAGPRAEPRACTGGPRDGVGCTRSSPASRMEPSPTPSSSRSCFSTVTGKGFPKVVCNQPSWVLQAMERAFYNPGSLLLCKTIVSIFFGGGEPALGAWCWSSCSLLFAPPLKQAAAAHGLGGLKPPQPCPELLPRVPVVLEAGGTCSVPKKS